LSQRSFERANDFSLAFKMGSRPQKGTRAEAADAAGVSHAEREAAGDDRLAEHRVGCVVLRHHARWQCGSDWKRNIVIPAFAHPRRVSSIASVDAGETTPRPMVRLK